MAKEKKFIGWLGYCAYHKFNVSYTKMLKKNCLYRNKGNETCFNFILYQDNEFWHSPYGQKLLSKATLNHRFKYYKKNKPEG